MNDILKLIADNQVLTDALRTVLEREFEAPKNFMAMPATTTDEVLGQALRARIVGLNAIDNAFKEIAKYKTVKETKTGANPAR